MDFICKTYYELVAMTGGKSVSGSCEDSFTKQAWIVEEHQQQQ